MKKLFTLALATTLVGSCIKKTETKPQTEVVKPKAKEFKDLSLADKYADIVKRAKAKYKTIDDEKQLEYFVELVKKHQNAIKKAQESGSEQQLKDALADANKDLLKLNEELKTGV